MGSNKLFHFVVAVLFALSVVASTASARAGIAGREAGLVATNIYVTSHSLLPNTSYAIETLNLSPDTADTVLHVQAYPGGEFVAGNDDCPVPGSGFRSCVTVGSSPVLRLVWIIVRSRSFLSGGTGTLRITPSQGGAVDLPISFFSGATRAFAAIPQGTHLITAEEPRGAEDTVLLVTSGTSANAIAFDDVDGVADMAAVHMAAGCTSECKVIIGTRPGAAAMTTTLVWDQDADVLDTDQDGLSNTLESAIATSMTLDDTDGDGIKTPRSCSGSMGRRTCCGCRDTGRIRCNATCSWRRIGGPAIPRPNGVAEDPTPTSTA